MTSVSQAHFHCHLEEAWIYEKEHSHSQLSFASRNKENRCIIKGTIKESFNFRENP
jgi:hypothetical protein